VSGSYSTNLTHGQNSYLDPERSGVQEYDTVHNCSHLPVKSRLVARHIRRRWSLATYAWPWIHYL